MTWSYDSEKKELTISGTGKMEEYERNIDRPWSDVYRDIESIVVEIGVTRIGRRAFDGCSSLNSIELPNSVERMGKYAFDNDKQFATAIVPCSLKEISKDCFASYCSKVWRHAEELTINVDDVQDVICKQCGICNEVFETAVLTESVNRIYTGSPIEAKVTGTAVELTPVITYSGTNLVEGKPVNAGTYTAIMKVDTPKGDKTVSLEYEIERAAGSISGSDTYSKVYGDEDFTLDAVANHEESELQYEVTAGDDVIAIAGENLRILKAGEAKVRVSLPECDNYNGAKKIVTITVQKEAGYTIEDIDKTYPYVGGSKEIIALPPMFPVNCGEVYYGVPQTEGNITYSAAPTVDGGILSYTVAAGKLDMESGGCG